MKSGFAGTYRIGVDGAGFPAQTIKVSSMAERDAAKAAYAKQYGVHPDSVFHEKRGAVTGRPMKTPEYNLYEPNPSGYIKKY